jgi:protein-disulfide isomerase
MIGTGKQWLAALGGLIVGGGAVALAGGSGAIAADGDRAAIETVVREYILSHPEIIPEAMKRLQERDAANMLASNRKALETPFPGAWAGAKDGDATLVMFSDYSCGYCRSSVPDIERLLAEDKTLKIVWRELPILGPGSELAAREALSAAQQGKYMDFHRRMFAAGLPDAAKLSVVGKAIGLAANVRPAAEIDREIENNVALARTLGLTGTPSFVVGDRLLMGAVGYDALKKAVAEARAKKG